MKKLIVVAAALAAFTGVAGAQTGVDIHAEQRCGTANTPNCPIGPDLGYNSGVPGAYVRPGSAFTDRYGRTIQADQYGRPVVIDGPGDRYARDLVLNQFRTYVDGYGNHVYVDKRGRQTRLNSHRDAWGRTVVTGLDGRPLYLVQNGQIVTYSDTAYNDGRYSYGYGTGRDRDRDGVPNRNDRWPDDPRYR